MISSRMIKYTIADALLYIKRFARKIGDGENSRRTKTASCAAFVSKMCVCGTAYVVHMWHLWDKT